MSLGVSSRDMRTKHRIDVQSFFVRLRILIRLFLLGMLLLASCKGGSTSSNPSSTGFVHFVPNSWNFWSDSSNWTTTYGPAYADVLLQSSNFVPCRGGPYALCYYSGPSSGPQNLSCTLTPDGRYANCQCYDIPYGVYFVDINAILNDKVYMQTVAQCGTDGSSCQTLNSAPVCQSVNQGNLMPGSTIYSTFSFDCVPTNGLGQTDCSSAPYAGCMTAPCSLDSQSAGLVDCSCPVFDGPYQVGQNEQACTLGGDLVWSAAYAPPSMIAATPTPLGLQQEALNAAPDTVPSPGVCLPDAPGGFGCPLYVTGTTTLPVDSGVDCTKVCDEYNTCFQRGRVQAGYTCDATLCTDECTDLDIVKTACAGLAECDISEIVKAETAAGCSCCASQLCGCNPTSTTNSSIATLNQQQRDAGITPQCDINGTLCGTP